MTNEKESDAMLPKCERCDDHESRLSILETDSGWIKETLDKISRNTEETARCMQQMVAVEQRAATMEGAIKRAFGEVKEVRDSVKPILMGWEGVVETSKWVKAGVLGVFALVIIGAIIVALNLPH